MQIGFFGILTLLLVVMKCLGHLTCSWWLVFTPAIIGLVWGLFWILAFLGLISAAVWANK